jgi:membrane protease subunit HflC
MSKAIAVVVGLLLLVLLVLFSTTYTVRFHEVAVKTTFGKEQTIQRDPGMHFRFPLFVDDVKTYDTRIQLVETPMVEAPTSDGQSVVVKAYLMWQVDPDNVLQFASSYPEKMSDADKTLRDHLQTAVKGGLGRYAFDDLIGADNKLSQAEQEILAQLGSLDSIGIEPVSLGISQMVLPAKTTKAVLKRMQATRQRLAEAERTRGNSEAVGIRSEAKSTVDKLRGFADQRAQELRQAGDLKAAELLDAMSVDEDLAIFLVWLDTLEQSLQDNTTIFLTDEWAPFHLMNQSNGDLRRDIPQPPKEYLRSPAGDEQTGADTDDDATASAGRAP